MSCCPPCPPSCVIPSCVSKPVISLGGCGAGSGLGGFGSGRGAASASSLGILAGVTPSPISQIPPSEVVIQPSPFVMIIPGPILSASCEPVSVGGYSACSPGSSSRGFLGARRKYSICSPPC